MWHRSSSSHHVRVMSLAVTAVTAASSAIAVTDPSAGSADAWIRTWPGSGGQRQKRPRVAVADGSARQGRPVLRRLLDRTRWYRPCPDNRSDGQHSTTCAHAHRTRPIRQWTGLSRSVVHEPGAARCTGRTTTGVGTASQRDVSTTTTTVRLLSEFPSDGQTGRVPARGLRRTLDWRCCACWSSPPASH